MDRDFKGIWIPKEIWLDKKLSWTEKLFLTEIDSLSTTKTGCYATNEYFADFFCLSKDRVSKLISSLKNKGYVEVYLTYKDGTKQVDKRFITTRGYRQKQLEGIVENNHRGIVENNEDINIDIINTNINTTKAKKENNIEKEKLFEDWWNIYNVKDRGSKSVAKKLFIKLTLQDMELVKKHTDYYIKVTEKKYRKNGDRYLRERIFECEITEKQDTKPSIDTKTVRRIKNIELFLDNRNQIYNRDKDFLEDILTDDRYNEYRYLLDKIKEAEIL